MSSSEEEEERRDRFRRERFEEKDSLERKRRRDDDDDKEDKRSDKEEKRRKVDDSKYKEISFFDRHWKSEWFQRCFNPIERKKAQNEREQNAKVAMMEFKNDDFEETSYEFETSPRKQQQESILIISDVPEEMSSEMFKEWVFEKLKETEKNLLKNIVLSNPLKRTGFERYALLLCENESALKSVQLVLSGVTMSFKSRNREVFRRIVVEKFRVSPVPKVILPKTKRSHERLLLDLHQALSLSDALDQLRHLDFTLRDYLEVKNLPSTDESDGLQTMRMLDICIEWLLRVHRWAYYNNCSFEQDGDLILARNEKYVRPKNTSQTDELKNVVVKASDYKDVDESKFDVGFVNLMKSLDRSVVSEREAKWDALEQDFLKEFEEEKNQEDTLRKITFQAFSTLCHEKDKIMSLENTRRHPRRNNNRSSGGGVMVPAPYFQRQHNGRMRFKDPDAVSSSSPLLSSQKRQGGKSTTPKKMDFDDF
eukprot:g5617.t1